MNLNKIFEWLLKCFFYFLPILLMAVRYNSFLVDRKKTRTEFIVDDQFCIVPFCFALDTIISFFRNSDQIEKDLKSQGTFCVAILAIVAISFLLLYWDLSYVNIQTATKLADIRNKNMEFAIIVMLIIVISLSFYVHVFIF